MLHPISLSCSLSTVRPPPRSAWIKTPGNIRGPGIIWLSPRTRVLLQDSSRHLLWLLCLLIVPTANDCDAITDSLTREDNALTVHFSSLGIVTVPSSPICPRKAGPSEAPQLVIACQTTLNIEPCSFSLIFFVTAPCHSC